MTDRRAFVPGQA